MLHDGNKGMRRLSIVHSEAKCYASSLQRLQNSDWMSNKTLDYEHPDFHPKAALAEESRRTNNDDQRMYDA
jgi:hypothetical protein